MGDLTKNLSRSEFACKCDRSNCNRTPVDYQLIMGLQNCVDYFMEQSLLNPELENKVDRIAITINSGYRCHQYDRAMKLKNKIDFNEVKVSEHVWGIAADFKMEYVLFERDANNKQKRVKINDDKIATYLEAIYIGKCGIGRYNGRTHFDVRPLAARWDNRSKT